MKAPKLPEFKSTDVQMLALAIVAVVVVYYIGKKLVTASAQVVGGVASGNNALTAGTPYAGAGILGTLGAAFNSLSGGTFQSIGDSIGSGLADLTLPDAATTVNSAGSTNQDSGGDMFGLTDGSDW